MIDEAGRPAWIDARESALRVLAGCSATIVAGWAAFAVSQVSSSGWWSVWTVGGFSSLLWCAPLVARAFGRGRNLLTWLFAGLYVVYVPFIALASRVSAATFGPAFAKSNFALTGGNLSLGIASTIAFVALTVAGCFLERPRVLLTPRRPYE